MSSSSLSCRTVIFILMAVAVAGCSNSGTTTPPGMTGNTVVSLLVTSTASDHLSQFALNFTSVALTSQSGKTVPLLSVPQDAEFTHLSGIVEPLVTASVPQGVYTSATATISYANFACTDLNATGGLQTNSTLGGFSVSTVTVNLPSPITVTGVHMGLVLNLLVAQSLLYPSCDTLAAGPDTVSPTFALTPVTFASQPTNSANGLVYDLEGVVGPVNLMNQSIQVTDANGVSWTLSVSGATAFQGVADLTGIAPGVPVSLDAAIQPDGSLLAKRVAVLDTNTATLTTVSGPLLQVANSQPTFSAFGTLEQGHLVVGGASYYSFGNATFEISDPLPNLQSLPFPPTFTGTNIVPGQRIFLTTHASTVEGGPIYEPVATVALLPQTLNGTVTAVANDGSFATYTITLAPYDLFNDLAIQAGQKNLVQNPNTVVVYVDSSVQTLNMTPLAAGSTLRFYGLVFNDNGTLKMDCVQITDGVNQ